MLARSFGRLLAAGLVCVGLAAPTTARALQAESDQPLLTNADCGKCHLGETAVMQVDGARHKAVRCRGCHAGHKPITTDNVPRCAKCHEGNKHFQLQGCLSCHNPHKPLKIELDGNFTDPCLTCHDKQIVQLRENHSRHTKLDCSFCHKTHRVRPDCTLCHKTHGPQMTQADCKRCHSAHKPKAIVFASSTPNADCATCHGKAVGLLEASPAKHHILTCVKCHKGKHRTIPNCQDCHGQMHPSSMMARFPKCGECHGIAHDINSFPGADSSAPFELNLEKSELENSKLEDKQGEAESAKPAAVGGRIAPVKTPPGDKPAAAKKAKAPSAKGK